MNEVIGKPTIGGTLDFRVFDLPVMLDPSMDGHTLKLVYTIPWRKRLFSWPWRPWVKTRETTIRTEGQPKIEADGETMKVTFKIEGVE